MKSNMFSKAAVLLSALIVSPKAFPAPEGLTFQGRLVDNGVAVESSSVTLKLTIKSPGANECVLFEETHALNMSNSDGIFSVKIGGGVRTANDEGFTMSQVFSNTGLAINNLSCTGGAVSYTPASADSRNVYVSFVDGGATVSFSSPYVIQSVPYALEALKLAGKSSSEYLQTTPDTTQSKINALMMTAPYTELLDLIGGTSTQYMSSASAISTSGNFSQSGATSLSTGTGGVALNGPTTVAANQDFSMASGTGAFAQTYTGTGTAHSIAANSVTTSTAQSIAANGLTSGSILSLSSTSTAAAAGNTGLNIAISGANSSSGVTRTGLSSIVTSTGSNSSNVGGYFSASGATNNYGLVVASGNVGIGTASPASALTVVGANNPAVRVYGGGTERFSLNMVGGVPHLYGWSDSGGVPTDLGLGGVGSPAPLHIKANGNVGIGTVSPQSPLQVQGYIQFDTAAGAPLPPATATPLRNMVGSYWIPARGHRNFTIAPPTVGRRQPAQARRPALMRSASREGPIWPIRAGRPMPSLLIRSLPTMALPSIPGIPA